MADRRDNMILMVTILVIIAIPGMVVNNMVASGLIIGPSSSCASLTPLPGYTITNSNGYCLSCPSPSTDPNTNSTCTIANPVGCQANAGNCNLQTNSTGGSTVISFLNPCSPFTQLFQFNFIGFVASIFSNCGAATVQSSQFGQLLANPSSNETISTCTATYSSGISARQWSCTTFFPAVTGLTSPLFVTCLNWNQVIGNAILGTVPSATFCNIVDSAATPNGFTANCWLYGTATDVTSAICQNFSVSQGTTTPTLGTLLTGNILGFFLSLLGAAILILLGLGINVGAATVILGVNTQGTKMAQVFGIGLLVWGMIYSEFSIWFTSGFLPYGLDGGVGIIGVGLTLGFLFSMFKMSQSGGSVSH